MTDNTVEQIKRKAIGGGLATISRGNRLRSLLSSVQQTLYRSGWMGALGLTHDNNRDLYTVFGYKRQLTEADYWSKYARNGIAKRVVDMPVDALWSDPPMIKGNPRFQSAWDNIVSRNKVFQAFIRLDVMTGMGPYACLLVGYDDGLQLSNPVIPGKKNITYLQPYSAASMQVKTFDEDPTSPRFGLPLMYEIVPGNATGKNDISVKIQNRQAIQVHYTRVLHVADNVTENPVFGHARLECVMNYLDDLEKVGGGAAETWWMTANRGMQIDIDKEMELDDDEAEALSTEVEEYQHQQRRFIRTRGVKIQNLGSDVADPRGTFETIINLISGSTGIPQRILIGSEAGQLASEQDRANWANRVQERIARYGGPVVLLPFIEMQIQNGVLPNPTGMTVQWPDAFKLSPLERGQASAQMARSAANIVKVMSTPIADDGSGVAIEEINEVIETESDPGASSGGFGSFAADPKAKPGAKPPAKDTGPKKSEQVVSGKKYKPSQTLLTFEEARTIIGFGKHAPVFDDKQDADATNKPSADK
jgi:hypothetical protein